MKVILFGGTGMLGQAALRECLLDPEVTAVLAIGRSPTCVQHAKLRELVHRDLWNYSAIEGELAGFDACFFCLGIASAGMSESDYERITYGITMAAAGTLSRLNPQMTFVFISGAGSDSTEQGRLMWARIKGKTENALMRLPFRGVYCFRPGFVIPLHGIRSRTALYRISYAVTKPLLLALRPLFPGVILTSDQFARAMLIAAKRGASKRVLESRDIGALNCEQAIT